MPEKKPTVQSLFEPPVNRMWDELHEMRKHCLGMIAASAQFGRIIDNPENLSQVKDVTLLVNTADDLLRGLHVMNDALDEIYNSHKHLVGGTEQPQECMQGIVYGEAYYTWIDEFNNFIMPMSDVFKNAIQGGVAVCE